MREAEIVLLVDGDMVETLNYADEELLKQLIQAVKRRGVDPVEVKEVPCG